MPSFSINVASVSWVDQKEMAQFSQTPMNPLTQDKWLRELCYGMSHTANAEPPAKFDGRSYSPGKTLDRAYRAITTFTIGIQIDDKGKFIAARSEQAGILDPGYTPPFDNLAMLYLGATIKELTSDDWSIFHKIKVEARNFSKGTCSSLSKIIQPGNVWQSAGVSPMKFSTISVNPGEIVLGHSLIKFRAGDDGDYLGIVAFGAPNHVPWVWCETVITYTGRSLVVYCSGSGFPSHKFYCNGQEVLRQPFDSDLKYLKNLFTSGLVAHRSYKFGGLVFTGINTQSSSTESSSEDIIYNQENTAPIREGMPKRLEIPIK